MSRRATLGQRLATLGEGVRIAWDAIRGNRVRAILTILGVGIGVSVVVIIAALITGVRSSVAESFEDSGPDNFIVFRFDPSAVRIQIGHNDPPWAGRPVISEDEARRVAGLSGVESAVYVVTLNVSAESQGELLESVGGRGVSADWTALAPGEFIAGRNFSPTEVELGRPIAVITEEMALDLFGGQDPVGREIRMASARRGVRENFRVIGVIRRAENIFSGLAEEDIYVPWTSALKRLKATRGEAHIVVVPEAGVRPLVVQDRVIAAIRQERGLGPRDENNFDVIASAQLLELLDQFTEVFFLIMLALSSAGLMVGGVGVIGIMLISVTERTREIGIRKALGATRREILWQFLVEAGMLTLLGALVGLGLGAAIAYTVSSLTPIPARIPLWSVAAALAAALLTGIVFGILPAQRAARLAPVDALRAE